MTWNLKSHTLKWPLTLASGARLEVIELRAFSNLEFRQAMARAGAEEEDQFLEVAALASGLSVEDLGELKRPDFVSVSGLLLEYVNCDAEHFLGRKFIDPDVLELLVPLKVIGGAKESLGLEVPALKAVKIMRKMPVEQERVDWMAAHCTGLSVQEIQGLSVPDWNQLQARLHAFLNAPASSFQSVTSK